MQAIHTKYHPVTNSRGSRISAAYAGGRIYVPYDHALNIAENHEAAATTLANSLGWLTGTEDKPTSFRCELVSGGLPDGSYAHCLRHLPDAKAVAA